MSRVSVTDRCPSCRDVPEVVHAQGRGSESGGSCRRVEHSTLPRRHSEVRSILARKQGRAGRSGQFHVVPEFVGEERGRRRFSQHDSSVPYVNDTTYLGYCSLHAKPSAKSVDVGAVESGSFAKSQAGPPEYERKDSIPLDGIPSVSRGQLAGLEEPLLGEGESWLCHTGCRVDCKPPICDGDREHLSSPLVADLVVHFSNESIKKPSEEGLLRQPVERQQPCALSQDPLPSPVRVAATREWPRR